MHKLIPDWKKPKAIALVWPEHLSARREELIGFYKEFICLLSKYIPVKVLFCTSNRKYKAPKFLQELNNVDIIEYPQIGDIWLRDYGPIPVKIKGSVLPVRGKYQPYYHITEADKKYGKTDDNVGNNLSQALYGDELEFLKVGDQFIILDGGNLIHNGNGTAIITNRIISDNENLFIDDLKESLKHQLGINELHIIPTVPEDDTGHADGLVRFISSSKLIISEYQYPWAGGKGYISKDEYKELQDFVNSIADYFESKNFTVTRMPNGVPKYRKKFESAEGNYTNFLRVGDYFFLPQYENSEQNDKAKLALITSGINKNNIIPAPNCTQLAKEGGVLNCITTHVY